jgi:phenol 2-monooxygenase (NADPH)
MQDAFNLGWKLAAVLEGRATPALLHTYSAERQEVARRLIEFDRQWIQLFTARPQGSADGDAEDEDGAFFQREFAAQGRYTAGVATHYEPSMICGEPTYQGLAKGFPVGERFHSAPVIRLGDARPLHLGHVARADGRWRLYAFSDAVDPGDPTSRIRRLCDFLAGSDRSPIRRFTPAGADVDGVFDLRAVFQQGHSELALEALPPLLLPRKGRLGLIDYEKVFCPDLKSGADIFDMRGVDRDQGCLVVVRPDQYVAHVLPLDGHDELCAFFERFMIEAPDGGAAG